MRAFGKRYVPQGSGATLVRRTCLFANTPDEHVILGHHPGHPQVVIASPCSGHGYKRCSVVGEIVPDLASGSGRTRHEIGFLRADRLVRRARYMTLETMTGVSDDPLVSLPAMAA